MRILEGIVVSVGKMKNTIIVEVSRRTPHPKYKKLIKRSRRYKVDTNGEEIELGKKVKMIETKPYSKDKYFKISEVVGAAKKAKADKENK